MEGTNASKIMTIRLACLPLIKVFIKSYRSVSLRIIWYHLVLIASLIIYISVENL
jgi:uncharacterized membrane protein